MKSHRNHVSVACKFYMPVLEKASRLTFFGVVALQVTGPPLQYQR